MQSFLSFLPSLPLLSLSLCVRSIEIAVLSDERQSTSSPLSVSALARRRPLRARTEIALELDDDARRDAYYAAVPPRCRSRECDYFLAIVDSRAQPPPPPSLRLQRKIKHSIHCVRRSNRRQREGCAITIPLISRQKREEFGQIIMVKFRM